VVHKLLSELPADFPVPVVVVQHINAAFSDPLGSWLAASSKLQVRVAKDGDVLSPGTVLLAPPQAHLVVQRGRVTLSDAPAREGHLPSATIMLESMAKAYGRRAVGVLLTGMGTDGVDGLAAIRTAGGKTVAQSQESSVVWGMPGAAVGKGIVDHIVHGEEMAQALTRLVKGLEVPKQP
jgi:two-component system chemotaxis response regulator CheB